MGPRLPPSPIFPFLSTFWNLNLTFLYQNTLPAPLVLSEGPLPFGASILSRMVTKSLQVYLWDWHGREKSGEWRMLAGFENAFSNVNPSHHRHSIASHRPSSVVAFYAKSQVGWARGPGTKMTLDMSQQQVQWEGSLASPRRPDRAAARGLWRLKGFCIVCFQSCAFSLECCFCSAGWVGVGVWMLLFAVF